MPTLAAKCAAKMGHPALVICLAKKGTLWVDDAYAVNNTMRDSMNLSVVGQTLYWMWIATEVAVVIVTRTRRGGGAVRDRGSLPILWVVIFGSIWAGSWFGETHAHTIFWGVGWVRTVSLVMFAAGLAIRWTAILSLGRSFSANVAIHATQTIHKTGLFRYVRHPSYLGMILIFIAMGLRTRNWIAMVILLVPIGAALMYRMHVEEFALRKAFGNDYEDYSRTTKRLIPGVY
jgi:protein-S-isoprenylcysteine O-methyltransferase Ste14